MNTRIIVACFLLATATAMPTNETRCGPTDFEELPALPNDVLLDMDNNATPSTCKCRAILTEIRTRIATTKAIGAKCQTNVCKAKVAKALKRLSLLRAAVVKRCMSDGAATQDSITVNQLDVASLAGDELDVLSVDEELSGRRGRVCRAKLAELNKRLRAAIARVPKCKTDACKATSLKAVTALRKAKAALLKRCVAGQDNTCPAYANLDTASDESLTGEDLDTMDEVSELEGRKECACRRKLVELSRRVHVAKARISSCKSPECRKVALTALTNLLKARAALTKRCTADFPCTADVSVEVMEDEELAGDDLDNMEAEEEMDGRKRCACKARLNELIRRVARNKARAATCKTPACNKATKKAASRIAAALKALKNRCGGDDDLPSSA